MGISPYLQRLGTKPGLYFVRAVPKDLQARLGKKHWRWKAGNDLTEARRSVPEFLVMTDRAIAEARGDVDALMEVVSRSPRAETPTSVVLEQEGMGPTDLYPQLTDEEAHRVVERQSRIEAGLPVERSCQDLIDLAVRLKDPAPSTLGEWKRHLSKAMEVAGVESVVQVTEAHARKYRDHLLDSVQASTTKTRLRYLKALFEVAEEEDWIERNPFNAIKLKRIKAKSKPKEVQLLDEADKLIHKLPDHQQLLYWLMKYSGCHVSEAAGIRADDIDLEQGILHIRENDLRPVKNAYRVRDIPIIPALRKHIEGANLRGIKGYVFPGLYEDKYKRWGNGMSWHRRIGVSPKACRDAAKTVLRDHGVNEFVIGSILGHTPKTSTNRYGSVTMDAKRKALELLSL